MTLFWIPDDVFMLQIYDNCRIRGVITAMFVQHPASILETLRSHAMARSCLTSCSCVTASIALAVSVASAADEATNPLAKSLARFAHDYGDMQRQLDHARYDKLAAESEDFSRDAAGLRAALEELRGTIERLNDLFPESIRSVPPAVARRLNRRSN